MRRPTTANDSNPLLSKYTLLYWTFSMQWNNRVEVSPTHTIGDAVSELGVIVRLTPPRNTLRRRAEALQEQIILGHVDDDIQAGIVATN